MMKKILAFVFVAVMGISTLTGCAHVMYSVVQDNETTESVQIDDIPVTEEYVFDYTEEVAEDTEEIAEDTEVPAEDTTEEKEEPASTGSGEVDFDVAEGTLENPAKIGEWVATKTYSGEDEKYHTIYYRITSVIRGGEAQAIVDDYNNGDHFVRFDSLEHDDLEYCVVTYETHYPSDFPEGEYGLYSADVELSACNLEDYGSIENYIGLSSVWDISEDPEDFHAGDTFTDGKTLLAMAQAFSDYSFYSGY